MVCERLEPRSVPSTVSLAVPSSTGAGKQTVSIDVPSTLISQSAGAIELTLTRSGGGHQIAAAGPSPALIVSAAALAPAKTRHGKPTHSDLIAGVTEPVSFASGETSQTVVIPVHPNGPLPGAVPIQITVAPAMHPRAAASITLELVNSLEAVPPAITSVRILRTGSVANGIAVTFSQPMAPAVVENLHNYSVRSVPQPQLDVVRLGTANVLQLSPYTSGGGPQHVPIKAARYNAATRTVVLIPKERLTPSKSFTVSSAASLGAHRTGPLIARPLTDVNGNVLNPLSNPPGYFSITISPTHPYGAPQPSLSKSG
jgi:hypothetical protein